jgi:hypothetical protein
MVAAITITRNSDDAKLILYTAEVPNADYSLNKRKFEYQIPEGESGENIAIDLGTEQSINISFKLLDTTNTSESIDDTGALYTINQKLTYFDSFWGAGIEANYTIEINSNFGSLTKNVTLESWNINFNNQNPQSLPGSIRLSLGGGNQ